MAGVTDDMTMTTRALRQEVVHVPSPAGFDFERNGIVVSDSDISCYCRPEHGNHILIGSERPAVRQHAWVADDADYDRNFTAQWNVLPCATLSAFRGNRNPQHRQRRGRLL